MYLIYFDPISHNIAKARTDEMLNLPISKCSRIPSIQITPLEWDFILKDKSDWRKILKENVIVCTYCKPLLRLTIKSCKTPLTFSTVETNKLVISSLKFGELGNLKARHRIITTLIYITTEFGIYPPSFLPVVKDNRTELILSAKKSLNVFKW